MKWLAGLCGGLLLASNVHAVTIRLLWDYTDGQTPAVSFSIFKDAACDGGFILIGSVPRNTLTFRDGLDPADPLIPGQRYCYEVTAVSALGDESTPSNVASFQVPIPPPKPLAPSNLHGVIE